jgi:hypothetical protein
MLVTLFIDNTPKLSEDEDIHSVNYSNMAYHAGNMAIEINEP